MSLLSAIPIGLAVGFLLGGRPGNLEQLRLRWPVLIVSALVMQVELFTGLISIEPRDVPGLYLISNALALLWLLRNFRVAGMPCIALGTVSNVAAIAANGGRMPQDSALLIKARGRAFEQAVASGQTATNGVIADAHTRLLWLTDRFLLPPPFPFPVVFSVGDVLIGVGVAWLIAAGMAAPRVPARPETEVQVA
jgi:hypothetical protein